MREQAVSGYEKYGLVWGIVVSLALHGVLFWKMPELPVFLEEKQSISEKFTEVELIKPPAPKPPTPKGEKPPLKEELKEVIVPPPKPPPKLHAGILSNRVEEIGGGRSLKQTGVEIKLPLSREKPEVDPERAVRLQEQLAKAVAEKIAKSPFPADESTSRLIPIKEGDLERKELEVAPPEAFPRLARLEPGPVKEGPVKKEILTGRELFQIKGPAGERRVVYRPKPPAVELEAETEIVLKFWVLPGGEVGRVIPIKKGEPELETKAIAYLKEWRFNPLSAHEPQVEQEGTIPIRFTLK